VKNQYILLFSIVVSGFLCASDNVFKKSNELLSDAKRTEGSVIQNSQCDENSMTVNHVNALLHSEGQEMLVGRVDLEEKTFSILSSSQDLKGSAISRINSPCGLGDMEMIDHLGNKIEEKDKQELLAKVKIIDLSLTSIGKKHPLSYPCHNDHEYYLKSIIEDFPKVWMIDLKDELSVFRRGQFKLKDFE